jgi:hypothetical protein
VQATPATVLGLVRAAAKQVGERTWCPHKPFPKQQAFLALTCGEALYGGAAGSAKSDALLMAALQYVDVPGYSAILFRRTFADLSKPKALMDRAGEWLAGTAAKWNDRDKQWRFPSGASLSFGYLDGPRDHLNYQGGEYQFIGLDEQAQLRPSQTRYLASRLRRLKGVDIPLRMRGATNPGDVGHDYLVDRYGIPEEPGDDVIWAKDENGEPIAFVPARLEDNPYIDREEYEKMLAKLDPVTYDQLRRGKWIKDASTLVYKFSKRVNCIDDLPALPRGERWTHVLAMDFGVTDPTAFAVLAFTRHDPVVYVVESEQWTDMAPSEAAEMVKAWGARYGGFERLIGDIGGLGKGYEAEFRKRFALPVKAAAKNDKLGYIKLLNGDLTGARLKVVTAKNEQLVEDIGALQWSDGATQKERPDMPNHTTDALLYGWRECRHWAWDERPKPRTHSVDERATDWRKRLLENDERDWQRREQPFGAVSAEEVGL